MNTPSRDKHGCSFAAPRTPARHRHPFLFGMLLVCLLLALASAPRGARAECWFTNGSAPTVSFNAGTINLNIGTQPSTTTPIWQSQVITPPGNAQISCNGNTNNGIAQSIAGPPTGADNTLFPTNIPGISYRLSHVADAGSYNLPSYPNNSIASGDYNLSGTTQMKLYYTGPYLPPDGGSISGSLARWNADICSNPNISRSGRYRGCNSTITAQPFEYFNISATITVHVPTCDIDPGSVSKTVALPSVTTAQFTGPGSTSGNTPFSLHLINCPSNLGVYITLDSSSAQPGATGVIAPAGAGYATGIGVQILKANGTTPVTFGSIFQAGNTSGTTYDINLNARYYQTGSSPSGGLVKAVATYTLNYQ